MSKYTIILLRKWGEEKRLSGSYEIGDVRNYLRILKDGTQPIPLDTEWDELRRFAYLVRNDDWEPGIEKLDE